MKNSALGSKIAKKFNIGDFVYWSHWETAPDESVKTIRKYGILINIVHYGSDHRGVVYAKVLPLDSAETIELNISKIRKKETN